MVFYAPVLFSSLGMGQDAALLSSVITGAVFVAATIISILTVDTFGRRVHLASSHLSVCKHSHCLHTPLKAVLCLCLKPRQPFWSSGKHLCAPKAHHFVTVWHSHAFSLHKSFPHAAI